MHTRLVLDRPDSRRQNECHREPSDCFGVTQHDVDSLCRTLQDAGSKHIRNRSLRHFLEARGPLLAAFGRYLSSRIDLLPYSLCEELLTIPDTGPPLSPDVIGRIFAEQTGVTPDKAFLSFDAMPFESRHFWQSHHAVFGGIDVDVRIMHPQIAEWSRNAKEIGFLEVAFAACGTAETHFREAVTDFRRDSAISESFESELQAFGMLARDAKSFHSLGVPRIYQHLSTTKVLVCDRSGTGCESAAVPSPEQARMICFAWLRQALQGLAYPVEPLARNVAISPEGQIVFTSGPFATVPEKMKKNLLEYLTAVAAQDADQAYTHLSRMISPRRTSSEEEELRRRFRQMSPFRDGFGSTETFHTYEKVRFTEEVLIHWRIAQELAGMDANLISFYRGLFHIVRTAGMRAPGRDSLLEAFYDLRLLFVIDDAKNLVSATEMAGLIERYAAAALGMPVQMDRILTALTTGEFRADRLGSQPAPGRSDGDRYAAVISLLLALVGVVMLVQKMEPAARSPGMHYAVILLFVGFGATLLVIGSKL